MSETSIYKKIQEIVKAIRASSLEYNEMLDILTEAGMEEEDAEKLLERLISQVEDE